MAAISLFWYTNMAAVTSDENDLFDSFQQKRNKTIKTLSSGQVNFILKFIFYDIFLQ
jgi:hypothetical protein